MYKFLCMLFLLAAQIFVLRFSFSWNTCFWSLFRFIAGNSHGFSFSENVFISSSFLYDCFRFIVSLSTLKTLSHWILAKSLTVLDTSHKWKYMSFCHWLISLSIMSSRFIHVVTLFRISFLLRASELQENLLTGEKQNRWTCYVDLLNIRKCQIKSRFQILFHHWKLCQHWAHTTTCHLLVGVESRWPLLGRTRAHWSAIVSTSAYYTTAGYTHLITCLIL